MQSLKGGDDLVGGGREGGGGGGRGAGFLLLVLGGPALPLSSLLGLVQVRRLLSGRHGGLPMGVGPDDGAARGCGAVEPEGPGRISPGSILAPIDTSAGCSANSRE